MMNKKKLSLLVVSGVLVTTIVGGSLAWFTSKDTKLNYFSTGSIKHEIVEVFEEDGLAKNLLPGDEVNKDVWINNTGKSDALLRVKVIPQWVNKLGEVDNLLDTNLIELVFADGVQKSLESGIGNDTNWILGNDGYFYYTSILPVNKEEVEHQSAQLLSAVRLSGEVSDQDKYAEKEINVRIESETVQVNKDAYKESWEGIENLDTEILTMLDNLIDEYKNVNNPSDN